MITERPMGVFSRQLFLGDMLDTGKLEAANDKGVADRHHPPVAQGPTPKDQHHE